MSLGNGFPVQRYTSSSVIFSDAICVDCPTPIHPLEKISDPDPLIATKNCIIFLSINNCQLADRTKRKYYRTCNMFNAFLMSPLLSRTRAAKPLSLTSSLAQLQKERTKQRGQQKLIVKREEKAHKKRKFTRPK